MLYERINIRLDTTRKIFLQVILFISQRYHFKKSENCKLPNVEILCLVSFIKILQSITHFLLNI